jgi:predicted DNA-binding transcriptional regulator YafY
MSHPASRLITLIMLMQRQPGQKASELAEKLGVSVRTLHRYMEMLDEMGIPVYSERGPYGGFSLVRGYRMPPLVLSPEEAVAVSLGTSLVSELWGRLYQDAAQGALAKLDNLLPDEQRSEVAWARRSLIATRLHRSDQRVLAPTLETLRQAIRENRRVQMSYRSMNNPEPTQRELDPYALAFRSGWWYLIGYCHLRQGLRTFRVDRIQELTPSGQSFDWPEGFDVRQYLDQEFQDQPQVRARMRFAPQAASIALSNISDWESVQELPDGSVEISLLAPDLYWLASMALSFGPIVTVLEPEELRQMVREWAQATKNLYS